MNIFGRYNSGILTINNCNSVEFDNTDEHVLIKIPENKESRELLISIKMKEGWFYEEYSSEIALGIYKLSFYKYSADHETGKTVLSHISDGFLSAVRIKLLETKRKNPDLKRALIFGACATGKKLINIAVQSGYEIVGFIDNYVHYSQQKVYGHPVFSPDKILELKPHLIAIASQSNTKTIMTGINTLCRKNNIKVTHKLKERLGRL